jgi:hypothetical protein
MSLVTHTHAKELGYCNAGLRRWCAVTGVDYREFLLHGISSVTLKSFDDAMATRLAEYVEGGSR